MSAMESSVAIMETALLAIRETELDLETFKSIGRAGKTITYVSYARMHGLATYGEFVILDEHAGYLYACAAGRLDIPTREVPQSL